MIDFSAVIVNYNSKDLLRKCLTALLRQSKDISGQIVVVDNASSDGGQQMVAAEFPAVRLICNRRNIGCGAANNRGIKSSGGKYVLLMNPDVALMDGAISAMIAFMDAHKSVGVLGCQLLNLDGSLQVSCHWQTNPLKAFALANGFYDCLQYEGWYGRMCEILGERFSRFTDFADHRKTIFPDWVVSACILVRRQALEDAGLFDEDFFLYWEETDLCYRIRQHGWQIAYTPTAQAIHLGGVCTTRIRENVSVLFWQNMIRLYEKHYRRWAILKLRAAVVTGIAARQLFSSTQLRSDGQRPARVRSVNHKIIKWMLSQKTKTTSSGRTKPL